MPDWENPARALVGQLRNDCAVQGPAPPIATLLAEVEADPGVARALAAASPMPVEPVLLSRIVMGGREVLWLTLLMRLGAMQDAVVEHPMIEQLLPADDAARAVRADLSGG